MEALIKLRNGKTRWIEPMNLSQEMAITIKTDRSTVEIDAKDLASIEIFDSKDSKHEKTKS